MMFRLVDIFKTHKLKKIVLSAAFLFVLMSFIPNAQAENNIGLSDAIDIALSTNKTGMYKSTTELQEEQLLETLGAKFGDTVFNKKIGAYYSYLGDYNSLLWELKNNPFSVDNTVAVNFGGQRVFGMDSNATNKVQQLDKRLRNMVEDGLITQEDAAKERKRITGALQQAQLKMEEIIDKDEDLTDEEKAEKKSDIRAGVDAAKTNIDTCSTIDELRQKYQAGCWSCLVVEKVTSAFLQVASKAYSLSQRAGLTVLLIGSIMWLLVWGLKNMSSLTQLQPANIVNDLIKFAFKIMLAYLFIVSGLKIVGTYFINPIMGTGAVIAQQFWPVGIKEYTQDYSWDNISEEEYKEIEQVEKKAIAETQKTPVPQAQPQQTQTRVYTDEEKRLLDAADQNAKNFTAADIPNFIIPPTYEGHLTSPVGCRIPPTPTSTKYHMGLDIGTYGKSGGAVVASGPGTITYTVQKKGGKVTGAGYYAIIVHDSKWTTRYFHMLPNSSSSFGPSGRKVKQGEQIGYIGNTGTGTGAHLHFETMYKGQNVEPLSLLKKKIILLSKSSCTGKNITPFPEGFKHGMNVPTSAQKAWTSGGKGVIDLSSTYITGSGSGGGSGSGMVLGNGATMALPENISIPEVTYTGPTDIMSKSVMNSILGATKAITNTTAENMVLGNAIVCYSTLDNGGAWHIPVGWFGLGTAHVTNFLMWLEGAVIWCTGFVLTLAIAYYLIDISFKIGFAVIALPIVVGLWPFKMTSSKFSACLSIIFKSSALFAFLAITSSYAMYLISEAIGGPDGNGLQRLYDAIDGATKLTNNKADIDFVADRLAIFSVDFIILVFAFIYSYKLIGGTVSNYVNKFFPDKMTGDSQPMHQWATAATKAVKDIAMKPAGLARDIAMHQTGRLATGAVKGAVGMVSKALKSGKKGNDGSNGASAAASTVKNTAAVAETASKGVENAGKGISAVSKAANAVPVVGQAVSAAGTAVGKTVETAGKVGAAAAKTVKESAAKVEQAAKKNNNDDKKGTNGEKS